MFNFGRRVTTWIPLVFLLIFPSNLVAQGLSPSVLQKVKAATVFVKAATVRGQTQGTGFFVHERLIATCAHVLGMEQEGDAGPDDLEIVLHSGIPKEERRYRGQVVGSNLDEDIAFVMVEGMTQSVPHLTFVPTKDLRETLKVFILGFPLGQRLAGLDSNPTLTVGQASISSLKNNDFGQTFAVQVDGTVIPGCSGGPIVDEKGNVTSMTAVRLGGTQIGFSIPGDILRSNLEGQTSGIRIKATPTEQDRFDILFRVTTCDPLRKLKAIQIYHWSARRNSVRPKDKQSRLPTYGAAGDGPRVSVKMTFDLQKNDWYGTANGLVALKDNEFWIQPAFSSGKKGNPEEAFEISTDVNQLLTNAKNSMPNSESKERITSRKKSHRNRDTKPIDPSPNPAPTKPESPIRGAPSSPTNSDASPPIATSDPLPLPPKPIPGPAIRPMKHVHLLPPSRVVYPPDLPPLKVSNRSGAGSYVSTRSDAKLVSLGDGPLVQMAASPDGVNVYAIIEGQKTLCIFDSLQMQAIDSLDLPITPWALWSDTSNLCLAGDDPPSILFFDSNSLALQKQVADRRWNTMKPIAILGRNADGSLLTSWRNSTDPKQPPTLFRVSQEGKVEYSGQFEHEYGFAIDRRHILFQTSPASKDLNGPFLFQTSTQKVIDLRSRSLFGTAVPSVYYGRILPSHDPHKILIPCIVPMQSPSSSRSDEAYHTAVASANLDGQINYIPGIAIAEFQNRFNDARSIVTWSPIQENGRERNVRLRYVDSESFQEQRVVHCIYTDLPIQFAPLNPVGSHIIYVPGREIVLYHDASKSDSQVAILPCGPLEPNAFTKKDPNVDNYEGFRKSVRVGEVLERNLDLVFPSSKKREFQFETQVPNLTIDRDTNVLRFAPDDQQIGLVQVKLLAIGGSTQTYQILLNVLSRVTLPPPSLDE